MASPLFGWSVEDVVKLVQICDRFFKAYGNGPHGASARLKELKEQVKNCEEILNYIERELRQQDRLLFFNDLLDSLKKTLKQCVDMVEHSEFLKPEGEQRMISRAAATAKYLWRDDAYVQKLSESLKSYIIYIHVFLHILQQFVYASPSKASR